MASTKLPREVQEFIDLLNKNLLDRISVTTGQCGGKIYVNIEIFSKNDIKVVEYNPGSGFGFFKTGVTYAEHPEIYIDTFKDAYDEAVRRYFA